MPFRADLAPSIAHQELVEIIASERLSAHFQPIVQLRGGEILGYEGLIRGPSDSALHSPLALFQAAERCGMLAAVERCALRILIRRFIELDLPGLLFLNASADFLLDDLEGRWRPSLQALAEAGLPPERIVIELTETRPVADYPRLRRLFTRLRSAGFALAIDDLGEGFASLRRWVELRPGFVKIDRYFIEGIHRDPLKQQFVRAMASIAQEAHARVIAEGVESPDELHVLQDLGFAIGQGYLFARPHPAPGKVLAGDLRERLFTRSGQKTRATPLSRSARTAGALARPTEVAREHDTCAAVHARFISARELTLLPVLDNVGRPVGVLRRLDVMERMSKPFMRELYGHRPCRSLMAEACLIFDAATALETVSEAVVEVDTRHYSDGFIVTRQGEYAGMATIGDLMRAITEIQIHAARYANPLTLLPGNVPLDDQVDRLIEEDTPCVVAYFDIDNFKPYNDVYGYRRGDDLIQFTAAVLTRARDPERDFLGHVGGDDFVLIFRSEDWEMRVRSALQAFDAGSPDFYAPEHRSAGGFNSVDRQGREVWHPLVTLSAGVVPVSSRRLDNHVAVATAAAEVKSLAKSEPGSTYFVDRRG